MRGMRHTARHLRNPKVRQQKPKPAKQMDQQLVAKILDRHGR